MLRLAVVALLVLNLLFFVWTRGWLGTGVPTPGHSQQEPERLRAQVNPDRLVVLSPEAARAATALATPASRRAPVEGSPAASAAASATANAATDEATAAPGTAKPAAAAADGADSKAALASNNPPALTTAAATSGPNPAPTPTSVPTSVPTSAPGAPTPAKTAASCLEAGPFSTDQVLTVAKALARLGLEDDAITSAPVNSPLWLVMAGRFADPAARRTRLQAWQRQGVPTPDLLDGPRELSPGLVFSRHTSAANADAALATLTQRHAAVATVARVVPAPPDLPKPVWLRVNPEPATAQRLRDLALPGQARFGRCLGG